MASKTKKLPLEVSTWMDKGLQMKRMTANSRLMTNEPAKNIILNRQFFADLLNLSFRRYRAMGEHDFEKRKLLSSLRKKSETSMPGLRLCVDQLAYRANRSTSSRVQSTRNISSSLTRSYAQSLFSRSGTESDALLLRKQQSFIRQKTAQPLKSRPDIVPVLQSAVSIDPANVSRRQLARERLDRLARPRGYRAKTSIAAHVRTGKIANLTSEDMFGEIDQVSEVVTSVSADNGAHRKPKSAADDKRFGNLVCSFSNIYQAQTPVSTSVKSIVQSNTSLQDPDGKWKIPRDLLTSRKTEVEHNRQHLINKLNQRVDVFLIETAA